MKYFLLLITILSVSATSQAERFYVSPQGTAGADGSSWSQAMDLQTALKAADASDEVWVQRGTYLPTINTNRSATFLLPAGIQFYGGFAGTETQLHQRQPEMKSVLSGDIGQKGLQGDNVYTVVSMNSSATTSTIMDGFVIENGFGRSYTEGFSKKNAGGGLFILPAVNGLSNHRISNCIFKQNSAHNGGAVYLDSGRPSFVGCHFVSNTADFNGGAIFNQGSGSEASPIFRDCLFEDNASNSGAGMTNYGMNGASSPLVLDCQFVNNVSVLNGAAIFNMANDNGDCSPVVENCFFDGNASILGNDVSDLGVSRSIASEARSNGGGILRPNAATKR